MKDLPSQPVSTMRRRSKHLVATLPIDLVGVAGVAVAAIVLLVVADVSSLVLRAAVGFPLLFFLPGYVTVATLFPRAAPDQGSSGGTWHLVQHAQGLTDVERVALSFGLSVALLPLLGLVIAITPWAFTGPIVGSTVTCFTLIGVSLATARRLSVPAADRYRVGFGRRLEAARAAIFDATSVGHVAINVVLVCSMLLALTTVGYALVAPQDGEQYTSLQLLTESETGDLVASGYPSEIDAGDSIPLVVAVENQEGQAMEYTAVVQEQRLEDGAVVERTELQRFDYAVAAGTTTYEDRSFTPETDEGTVRIAVLLYTGDDVPERPTTDNAYRSGYLGLEVVDTGFF